MHLEGRLVKKPPEEEDWENMPRRPQSNFNPEVHNEDELKAIFERTYGSIKQERGSWNRSTIRARKEEDGYSGSRVIKAARTGTAADIPERYRKKRYSGQEYLLVDGYNIIFGWDDLKELSEGNIEAARNKLMDILCNYQGYRKMTLILVFDAYKVEGNPGSVQDYHNIHVVYTKEAETADQYIEKVTKEISKKHRVVVATSDALEQVIILGQGAERLSARGLREEIDAAEEEIRAELERQNHLLKKEPSGKRYLFDGLPEEMANILEQIRLGENEEEE